MMLSDKENQTRCLLCGGSGRILHPEEQAVQNMLASVAPVQDSPQDGDWWWTDQGMLHFDGIRWATTPQSATYAWPVDFPARIALLVRDGKPWVAPAVEVDRQQLAEQIVALMVAFDREVKPAPNKDTIVYGLLAAEEAVKRAEGNAS